MKKFTDWIKEKEQEQQEACTDSGDVASFARPIGSTNRRMYPEPVEMDDEKKKKKK